MIISNSRKFIFIHIHKTAGEAITEALSVSTAAGDVVLGGSKIGNLRNALYLARNGIQKHSSARDVRAFVGEDLWCAYFTFSVVRDPVDRARSLYFYVQKMAELRQRTSLRNAMFSFPGLRRDDPNVWPVMQAFRESRCFSDFIRHPGFEQDPGSSLQVDLLSDESGALIVNFVARFETLQQDFEDVKARIGLPGASLGWKNASGNANIDRADITKDDIDYLLVRYARDYQAFGFHSAWALSNAGGQHHSAR